MVLLKKFKVSRDRGDKFWALFNDLSKAFVRVDHNLLITKLRWYEAITKSLSLSFSCLRNET